jgi:amidase
MARTVADAAILLGALTGVDPADPVTVGSQGRSFTDYTPFLDPNGLRGARLGVARNFCGFNPQVDKIFEQSLAVLAARGAELVDPANIATPKELDDAEMEVLLYEFKADLNAYLATHGPEVAVHSLAELIAYNEREQERVLPYFGQELLMMAEAKGPLTDRTYQDALETCRRLAAVEGIDAAVAAGKLDAIVAPSGGPAWLTDYVNGDHHGGGSSSPAAVAGYPNITVPAGYVWGLPVGISFFAGAYGEPTLLRIAYAFELATHARRSPEFRATVDLTTH